MSLRQLHPVFPYPLLTVRAAAADDLAAAQAFYALCISEAAWLPEPAKRAPVLADVSRGETLHVAATPAGVVVGFVSVQEAEPFIHHLYVHPDARGMQVGGALLASLQAWLPMPWHLKCVARNVEALRFYRRLGWEDLGSGESEHGTYLLLRFGQEPVLSIRPN